MIKYFKEEKAKRLRKLKNYEILRIRLVCSKSKDFGSHKEELINIVLMQKFSQKYRSILMIFPLLLALNPLVTYVQPH